MSNSSRNAVAAVAAVLSAAALAVPFIATHEGVVLKGYADPVGIPTNCVGHTGGEVVIGKSYTLEQCMSLLASDAVKHGLDINGCLPAVLPEKTRAAFISFAFNVGSSKFCTSTLSKKAIAGDVRGACAELSRWTMAGGRVLPGLVTRRAAERKLCEEGLST